MARSRRGGGMGRRPAPAPRRKASPAPPARQASTTTPAPVQPQSGGMLSGIGSTIAQGMAFGTGSAIGHNMIGAVAGSMSGGGEGSEQQQQPVEVAGDFQAQQQQQAIQGVCSNDKQMFFECLQVNRGDQQACSFLYEQLQQCQREQNQMQFG